MGGCIYFFQELTSNAKENELENERIASRDSVSIHLKQKHTQTKKKKKQNEVATKKHFYSAIFALIQ